MSQVLACPVCDSPKIVVVVGRQRRAFCTCCGARWKQEGSHRSGVKVERVGRAVPTGFLPSRD